MVKHFLPGRVKLTAVLLQPLLSQSDGLFGCPQDFHCSLELLSGLLGFNLGLQIGVEGYSQMKCESKVATSVLVENTIVLMTDSDMTALISLTERRSYFNVSSKPDKNALLISLNAAVCLCLCVIYFLLRSHGWSLMTATEGQRNLGLHTHIQT